MKHLLVALLLIGSATAQNKADNTILIPGVTFDSAVKKMDEMGYKIRVVDKEKMVCISQPSVSGLSIYVHQIKKGIAVTGEFGVVYAVYGIPGSTKVLYFKHGLQHDYWVEMMKYAGSFSGVEYARL